MFFSHLPLADQSILTHALDQQWIKSHTPKDFPAYLPIWKTGLERIWNQDMGVLIDDAFMQAVKNNTPYTLYEEDQKATLVSARAVWQALMERRKRPGLFLHFINHSQAFQEKNSEGMLLRPQTRPLQTPTIALNLEHVALWKDNLAFLSALTRAKKTQKPYFHVYGWSQYLQNHHIAFESNAAKNANIAIFSGLHTTLQRLQIPAVIGIEEALAPPSSYVPREGRPPNAILQQTLGYDPNTWTSIAQHQGSVQHLDLPPAVKAVFKTRSETDQRWVIEHASDRAAFVAFDHSLEFVLPTPLSTWDAMMLVWRAWEEGLADIPPSLFFDRKTTPPVSTDYMECLSCSF